ncbi:hypothetical protein ACP3T3_02005 [Chryseobacterium sp. CBSDS_008]
MGGYLIHNKSKSRQVIFLNSQENRVKPLRELVK